jgi:nitrogen-specific signal transduction histidine kinase
MGATQPGPTHDLIQELRHEIFSPLAAIRSALILVSHRSDDPAIQHYLDLANAQLKEIAHALRRPRP